jgi:hypothetical protein
MGIVAASLYIVVLSLNFYSANELYSLGPVSLAAQSVLLVSCSTTYQAPYALAIAGSVRFVRLSPGPILH